MEPSIALRYKTKTDIDSISNNADTINSNSNIPNYFRSSTNRKADEKASPFNKQRIYSEFSAFKESGPSKANLNCR